MKQRVGPNYVKIKLKIKSRNQKSESIRRSMIFRQNLISTSYSVNRWVHSSNPKQTLKLWIANSMKPKKLLLRRRVSLNPALKRSQRQPSHQSVATTNHRSRPFTPRSPRSSPRLVNLRLQLPSITPSSQQAEAQNSYHVSKSLVRVDSFCRQVIRTLRAHRWTPLRMKTGYLLLVPERN